MTWFDSKRNLTFLDTQQLFVPVPILDRERQYCQHRELGNHCDVFWVVFFLLHIRLIVID
jgi:hypothetical protein